jgi:hypothetical protein
MDKKPIQQIALAYLSGRSFVPTISVIPVLTAPKAVDVVSIACNETALVRVNTRAFIPATFKAELPATRLPDVLAPSISRMDPSC